LRSPTQLHSLKAENPGVQHYGISRDRQRSLLMNSN
jgi:hypothetical protein